MPTNTAMALSANVDWKKISVKEGGQSLKAYIPATPRNYTGEVPWDDQKWKCVNNSGVTIATGFDIGQRTKEELRELPLDGSLINKLVAFAAIAPKKPLAGKDAANKLFQIKGFTIGKSEADAIDLAVPRQILAKLIYNYEFARILANGSTPFLNLPMQIQTAIFSFAYQYGPDWRKNPKYGPDCKNYWDAIVAQDWGSAVNVLLSYKSQHVRRRHEEARWIGEGVKVLPAK